MAMLRGGGNVCVWLNVPKKMVLQYVKQGRESTPGGERERDPTSFFLFFFRLDVEGAVTSHARAADKAWLRPQLVQKEKKCDTYRCVYGKPCAP